MAEITTDQVWAEIEKQMFAVVGMVTARNEARTIGIVYKVHERKLYFDTVKSAWKTRHMAQNSHVSVTILIPKRILLLPWIPIPPATITFAGEARILEGEAVPTHVHKALNEGLEKPDAEKVPSATIEITPTGDFVTYGVGVSTLEMRDTVKARGRAAVA